MKTPKSRIKYYITTEGNGYIATRNDEIIAYRFYTGAWICFNNPLVFSLAKQVTAKEANSSATTLAEEIKRRTL